VDLNWSIPASLSTLRDWRLPPKNELYGLLRLRRRSHHQSVVVRDCKLPHFISFVIWMQSPPPTQDKIWPSFFAVPENTNAVPIVDTNLLNGLPENPQSQLNLIYFCRLALHPEPVTLPEFTANP
jgi:hypothetical protein